MSLKDSPPSVNIVYGQPVAVLGSTANITNMAAMTDEVMLSSVLGVQTPISYDFKVEDYMVNNNANLVSLANVNTLHIQGQGQQFANNSVLTSFQNNTIITSQPLQMLSTTSSPTTTSVDSAQTKQQNSSEEKKHCCPICMKAFKRRHDKYRHMSVHIRRGQTTAEDIATPYDFSVGVCIICGLSYRSESRLRAHCIKSHGNANLITRNPAVIPQNVNGQNVSSSIATDFQGQNAIANSSVGVQITTLAASLATQTASISVSSSLSTQNSPPPIIATTMSQQPINPSTSVQNLNFTNSLTSSTSQPCGSFTTTAMSPASVTSVSSTSVVTCSVSDAYKRRPQQCQHCTLRCGSRNALIEHIRTHTGERPFICSETGCGKAFSRKRELLVHEKVHAKRKLEKQMASQRQNWQSNVMTINNATQNVTQNVIQQDIQTSASSPVKAMLNSKQVSDAAPNNLPVSFKCIHCPQIFSCYQQYQKHYYLNHSEKNQVTTSQQQSVDKSTFTPTTLNVNHSARPGKNICPQCGLLCRSAFSFMEHLRTHTSERPFACKFCLRTFCRQRDVRYHGKRCKSRTLTKEDQGNS